MIPQPTGRLVRKDDGVYVVLDRIFKAPIEDVWSYFSRSPRLAEWLGEFTGTPSTGAARFRMKVEGDDAEWQNVSILECQAPHRLAADIGPSDSAWRMYLHLTEASGRTTVTFGRRLHDLSEEADTGVAWDYYLDRLIAARAHRPMPDWNDYHPAMLEHYENLCRELGDDLRREHAAAHAGLARDVSDTSA
ncbi:SRPBCC domain-containing protein [Leifsonia sp. NPDC058292]|uniref:SRPBCC domain-containing protein n=1 Tax=Leifsonia sp. NPDC058292 TaxID=3346428 RepID=UPI0036DD421F